MCFNIILLNSFNNKSLNPTTIIAVDNILTDTVIISVCYNIVIFFLIAITKCVFTLQI